MSITKDKDINKILIDNITKDNISTYINKYISESGLMSRRKADEYIEKGLVTIDDRIAVPGDKIEVADDGSCSSVVICDGTVVRREEKKVIVVYNKPLGLTCTSKEADKTSIYHKFDYPIHLNYVGRLDKDSQGLLLMTNDGELSNMIQKSRNGHRLVRGIVRYLYQ